MQRSITTDTHHAVGPVTEVYGHGPVTVIRETTDSDDQAGQETILYVCLDCGFMTAYTGSFAEETCDRTDNPINTTWRERDGGENEPTTPLPVGDET